MKPNKMKTTTVVLNGKKLVVGAIALVAAVGAFAGAGPQDYVQDGLVALYDAEFNSTNAQGEPMHDDSATVWMNLVKTGSDLPLPASGVTIGEKVMTFDCVTATATDCSVANLAMPVTLEACARSTASATTHKYDLLFVSVVNRAAIGFDARNSQCAVIMTTDVSDFTKSKKKYFWFVKSSFASYAPTLRTYSGVIPVNDGSLYANGIAVESVATPWTDTSAAAPTGDLTIGNVNIPVAFNCIRIYNRELTEEERQRNNAVDAVRFRGADETTVSPYGYAYDASGNILLPRIEETPATETIEPGAYQQWLVNRCSSGPVTFDERAVSISAAQPISFLGFEASGNALTTFLAGWWDFGLGGFFRSDSSFGGRTTVFDGAVVTNAGTLYLAGTSGDNNKLLLKGSAELHLNNFILGMKNGNAQNSRALVTDGSLLHCNGYISFNDCDLQASKYLSGNELVVSNAGSRLVVDGSTYLDRTQSSYNGGVGGNALVVTDRATAKLHALNVATSCRHSMSNRVTVSKGGYLETTSINLGTEWASGANTYDYTRFEVLDGGVVTNTGTLSIGYQDGSKHGRISVVVSNGVLYSATKHKTDNAIICVKDSEIVISGPNASYYNGLNDYTVRLFGPGAVDSRFIVENGAVVTNLPVAYGYTYMANTTRASLIVRNGGVLSIGNLKMASYNNGGTCVGNSFVAGSGASVTTDEFWCDCLHGTVTVDNAVLKSTNGNYWNAYGAINIGGGTATGLCQMGTNCVLNVKGHMPKIIALENRIQVDRASKVIFHLPSDGYASEAQPLVDNGGQQTRFGDDCALEFAGAEDLFAYHEKVLRKRGKYTLMRASSFAISDDILAAANASLPEGMEVKIEDGVDESGNKRKVMALSVKPRIGLMLIVR